MKKIIIKSIQRQTYEINHDFFNIEYPVFIDHLLILWRDEDSVVSNGTETIDDATTDDSTTDETLDFAKLFYGAERFARAEAGQARDHQRQQCWRPDGLCAPRQDAVDGHAAR